MKLLKLIPAAAIVLTAFTTFEAKAGGELPAPWTSKASCDAHRGTHHKVQNTDTPASWGAYNTNTNQKNWTIKNVSYNCATNWFQYVCGKKSDKPTCTS